MYVGEGGGEKQKKKKKKKPWDGGRAMGHDVYEQISKVLECLRCPATHCKIRTVKRFASVHVKQGESVRCSDL